MFEQNSEIVNFFKNQTILLAGSSHLLGKLVLEKLLRTCDVKKIYLLIRAEQNFEEIFEEACFGRLNDKKWKMTPIYQNDVTPDSNIYAQLVKEISCILNITETNFNHTLKEGKAICLEIRDILCLAQNIPNLKAYLYVSSLFSNCIHSKIEEKFYTPPLKSRTLFAALKQAENREPNEKGIQMILERWDKWPNTYIYVQSIAEDYIREFNLKAPISIIRPSIISPTFKEPVKGYCDSSLMSISDTYRVPADHVTNCILASCWYLNKKNQKEPMIFNCVGEKIQNLEKETFTLRKFFQKKSVQLLNIFRVWSRNEDEGEKFLEYSKTRDWVFETHNFQNMWAFMTDEDKKLFEFFVKNN